MFLYLFLAAALTASTEETIIIEPELQEIITLLTSEDATEVAEASSSARPDASTSSAVNTAFSSHCARPELVEGYLGALESTIPETVTEDTPATTSVASEPTSIIITNAIQPSMLAYKHWTGTYNPDKFTITVNDTEVAQGAQHTLPATTDPVAIRFDYSFVNGKRTGSHVISYQLDENITEANITFSWNEEWKVLVDNGKPVKHEEIKV